LKSKALGRVKGLAFAGAVPKALLQKSVFDENGHLKMAEIRDPKMRKTVVF
jgi:hypothetical protein